MKLVTFLLMRVLLAAPKGSGTSEAVGVRLFMQSGLAYIFISKQGILTTPAKHTISQDRKGKITRAQKANASKRSVSKKCLVKCKLL